MLNLCNTSRTYKDFDKSFYKVWADVFYNYITIFVSLFGKKAPDLYTALTELYSCIYELSIIFDWQERVFLIAIEVHTFIIAQQLTDLLKQVIPKKFQGRFCIPRMMKEMGSILGGIASNKRKRSRFCTISSRCVKNRSNNLSVICKTFNTKLDVAGF